MTDLWEDEGFGSAGGPSDADEEDDWDEEDESFDSAVEEGLEDTSGSEDEDWDDSEE